MRRFRTLFYKLVPGWLSKGQGEAVQYVLGFMKDAFAERMRQTAWLGLPSLSSSDSLDMIGRDRGLVRGLFEAEATFRSRLKGWRYPLGHRVRGSASALLDQVSFALRGTGWTSIDARGTRFDEGSTTPTRGVTWNWDGDSLLPNWGRYWLIVASTGAAWPSFADGAWGPTVLGTDQTCLGMSGVTPGEVDAVRKLCLVGPLGWTPAGRRPIYLVFYFSGSPFPAPDGSWDVWGFRDTQYRYVPLNSHVT